MPSVDLICAPGADREAFLQSVQRWQLHSDPNATLALVFTAERVELRKLDEPQMGAIWVDFVAGAQAHRRRFGGSEALLRALGIKGGRYPKVLDATAGMGRDAFVMAAAGCYVQMVERHPVVAALLEDGLWRGYQDPEIGHWLRQRLVLTYGASATLLAELQERPEVVYLDPMYPYRKKSALVKKEMRLLQQLVGADQDASQLLLLGRQIATRRVIVKRPDYALPLAEITPQSTVPTKNHRFDIYLPLS